MCTYMRARKYSIYIKSLKGVSARIRFQDQKSTRKGDTEMTVKVNDSKRFHFLMHELDARVNNETMDRYGIERQAKRLEEE